MRFTTWGTLLTGYSDWSGYICPASTYGATITIGSTTIAILSLESTSPAPALTTSYAELAGESVAMRQLFTTLQKIEPTEVNVHLYGEAGTGKELVARVIHKKSKRASGPFIAIDCVALADDAINIELFGRVGRGPGAVEQADGGTLYIEEFDAMPTSTQIRLKQVLERGETRRIDDGVRRKVNVRVIASAQHNLQEAVTNEALRPELYHQVAVITAKIPPLRERPEDIPHIANSIAARTPTPRKLTDNELQQLTSRQWPGNVRELRAVVLRTLALGSADLTQPSGAPVHDRTVSAHDPTYKEARERLVMAFEAQFVSNLMQKHKGNVSAAAREAKISRKHLHELLRRHRIG